MPSHLLIVGLGNPGLQYALHRHNIGFMAVDRLNALMRLHPVSRREGEVTKGQWEGFDVMTLKPCTFMNASGEAVQALMSFYKIPLTSVYVIHDDLDLPFGEVRFKRGGGDGGHNGLRSITARVGADYARVRLGIGRPPPQQDVTSYVLGRFSDIEHHDVRSLLDRLELNWIHLWNHPSPNFFLDHIRSKKPMV